MVRMALALRFVFRAMCFVLFSSDRSLAFMPFTLPNNALVCDLYRILIDIDWFSCVHTCYNEDRCISYNFKNSVSGTGLCELNKCGVEKSGTCNPKTLVYTPGFVFQQLRKETSQGATTVVRQRVNSTEAFSAHNSAHATPTKPLISSTVLSTGPALSPKTTMTSSFEVTPITAAVATKIGNVSRNARACRDGWQTYRGACYKLHGVTRGQSWRQANMSCHAIGATLASIDSPDENRFVFSVVTQGGSKWAWIGLSDLLVETQFQWSADNSLVNYTNWNTGEPNDGDGKGEDCVYIGVATAWNDSPCGTVVPFVCKYCPP